MKTFACIVLLLVPVVQLYAQQNNSSFSVVLTAEKTKIRINEPVQLTLTVRNVLQPLPPIELRAIANYTDAAGNEYSTASEPITIQVIRPVMVKTVNIPLPVGWEVVSGSLPMVFNLELTEGQSASRSIVIRSIQ